MDIDNMKSMLDIGENVAIEFKRGGNGIEHDTYESVCSFLNRFGGDIFIGVEDDGKVVGVPKKAATDMIRNFINVISNSALFSPTIYLTPEVINYDGCAVIHVHVPPSAEVHSYKRIIYDRVDDADVKVTSTSQIAAMYIRKQNIYTEKKIYPYVKMEDLRLDLLPRIRRMAVNYAGGSHPWEDMSEQELLKSAGLYGTDMSTGEKGFNLAAIMLLGKDDLILNVCPAYETDALVRKVNVDRYDDRETVRTNLIESYDLLMEFAKKHLPDKFFLQDTDRISIRNVLAREMLGNTLMHREFSSAYTAKFVIETDRMYVENANRSVREGIITPDNLEPNPKNPIIASFFRNIGRADKLGSGVRNLFKYSKYYSGKEPEFIEGDIFKIVVPLDEAYSFDMEKDKTNLSDQTDEKADRTCEKPDQNDDKLNQTNKKVDQNQHLKITEKELQLLKVIRNNPEITNEDISRELQWSVSKVKYHIKKLKKDRIIRRKGSNRKGSWEILVK